MTISYYELHGEIIAETSKAILFEVKYVNETPLETKRRIWFPLSQINKIHRTTPENLESGEDADMISVQDWIIKEKGLN
jgi:hypothetical protein